MTTNTTAALGPVSVTELSKHSSAVVNAVVEADSPVAVTRRGLVVAVIRPIESSADAAELGFDPRDHTTAVGARELQRGNVSELVNRAEGGEPVVLTKHNRPVAAFVPASAWKLKVQRP